jgi:3'-5' exoribonuclease
MSDYDRRLIDLKPADHFDGLRLAIVQKQVRRGQTGKPFMYLRLRDSTGICTGRWFQMTDHLAEQLNGTQLVRLRGKVDNSYRWAGDLILESVEPEAEPEDLSPWLPPLPKDHAGHKKRFNDLIFSVTDPHLKALLKEIFHKDREIWPQFEIAPAAKSMHHAYAGGLLEHSGEVALLCDRVASTMPVMNRDLLVTAALLHDIGKLEEMENGLNCGEYTPIGQLVGHVVLGTCTVSAAAERIEDFPPRLKHELMHLILSHHGRPEWGAARVPICAEAIVLSLCDLMSAQVAQCHQLVEQHPGETFVKSNSKDGGTMYLGLMQQVLAAQAAQVTE